MSSICCHGNNFIQRLSFGVIVGTMNKTANAMENGEYDFDGTIDKKVSNQQLNEDLSN